MEKLEQDWIDKIIIKASEEVKEICKRNRRINFKDKVRLEICLMNFYFDKYWIKNGGRMDFAEGIDDLRDRRIKSLETLSKKYGDIKILKKLSESYTPFIAYRYYLLDSGVFTVGEMDSYLYKFHEVENKIKKLEKMNS